MRRSAEGSWGLAGTRGSTASLLGLSSDLPERIEIVDRPDRIALLLPQLDEILGGGLVVIQEVQVLRDSSHNDRDDENGTGGETAHA